MIPCRESVPRECGESVPSEERGESVPSETGRRLADPFCEQLREVEKNNTDASKPVARHFNLSNHSHHNNTICGLSLHHGKRKAVKISNKNSFFNLMNASRSTNFSLIHVTISPPKAKLLYTFI